MNVILLERVNNLGDLGDEVMVKPGFARNFLIPQGKAVQANDANRAVFEERRAELERAANEKLGEAEARAAKLEEYVLTMVVKTGEEGKLYGSVGTQDIANAITAEGNEIARSEVRMPEGVIRVAGEYDISLQLHSDVTVDIKVNVGTLFLCLVFKVVHIKGVHKMWVITSQRKHFRGNGFPTIAIGTIKFEPFTPAATTPTCPNISPSQMVQ